MQPPALESIEAYRRYFNDALYWAPYVRTVCARHQLAPCGAIRSGLPGTYPTFIVDDRWVVKFFGHWFAGQASFAAELDVNRLLAAESTIPAPSLVAHGTLFEPGQSGTWPYLLFDFVSGITLGDVFEQLAFADKQAVARQLGSIVERLHTLPLGDTGAFAPTWDAYAGWLAQQHATCQQRHRAWGTLATQLIEQIDTFLLPPSQIVPSGAPPRLLHADITADHLLGDEEEGRWQLKALIDFGDAMVGDPLYELIALHLDAFRLDKRLLLIFLDAYGYHIRDWRRFVRKAMSLTLLHRFDVLHDVFSRDPQRSQVPDLWQLASIMWDCRSCQSG